VSSSATGALSPAGTEADGGENGQSTEVGGDAYQQTVAMETVDADDQVPDGDGQPEEATENMTSRALCQVGNEEGEDDTGQVNEVADDTETATETAYEQHYDDNERAEPETPPRRQSLEDSTEPPAAYNQSPEPGILL